MRQDVKDYYGKTLSGTQDLKTDACCTLEAIPKNIRTAIGNIHSEVLGHYYGCGLIAPEQLDGMRILDLGSGSGRDCYVLAQLVGENGAVVGVDMTDEQLAIANRHVDWHRDKFGFKKSNVRFTKGYIEKLDELDLEDNSFDIIVSNCVINLSPDKEAVLRESFRVLKPGGELYFSDVYADRRVPEKLIKDPVLYGECLSGALYWNDFLRLATGVGFTDTRLVKSRLMTIDNEEIAKKLEGYHFWSATYRLFKIDGLETACENYGQKVTYKGTLPGFPDTFNLDHHHVFHKNQSVAVCGNTWRMLGESRLAKHFELTGNFRTHLGIFPDCGQNVPFASAKAAADCCSPAPTEDSCCSPKPTIVSLTNSKITKAATDQMPTISIKKEKEATVAFDQLRELWFHTGTHCNLSCPDCLEGSKPGDKRIQPLSLEDAKPLIDEAMAVGVEQICFTGGEPFASSSFLPILQYSIMQRPCLVLSNGTKPLTNHLDDIAQLTDGRHPLSIRISLDAADAYHHDKIRGKGSFELALSNLRHLYDIDVNISVARRISYGENETSVNGAYAALFNSIGLPSSLPVVAFPDLLSPGSHRDVPTITTQCMENRAHTKGIDDLMCRYSRMVVKSKNKIRLYACTLVDDDTRFDVGANVAEAVKKAVPLSHHRCYACYAQGTSCSM